MASQSQPDPAGGGDAVRSAQPVPLLSDSAKNEAHDYINTSDFFNSDGELQLSAISQFQSESDSNASTSYDEINQSQGRGQKASTEKDSVQKKEDKSKSSSLDPTSNSSSSGSQKSKANAKSNDFSVAELVEKQGNVSSSSSCGHGKGGKKCRDKKCASKPSQLQPQPLAQLNTDNFQGFVHMLPKHLQPPTRPSTNQMSSPTSTSSPNTRKPFPAPTAAGGAKQTPSPNPSNSASIVRAPNFRLKSSEDEVKDPPYGNLTEAEIQSETKRLYEMDRAERELETQQILGALAAKPPASPASVIRNLFNASNPTPVNLLPSQENVAIPTLNDGLDELMNYYMHKYKVRPMQPIPTPQPPSVAVVPGLPKSGTGAVEVNEPSIQKSKAFVCGDQQTRESKVDEIADVIARCLPQRQTQNKNLSPLPKSPKSRAVNLKELDQLWKDIQETKAKMDQDIQARLQQQQSKSDVPQLLDASASKESAPCCSKSLPAPKQPNPSRGKQQPRSRGKKHGKKKPKSKQGDESSQLQNLAAAGDTRGNEISEGAVVVNPMIRTGLEQSSELSTLLQMAQLDESALLDNLLLDDMNDLDTSEFEDYQLPPEEEEDVEGSANREGSEDKAAAGDNDDDDEEECDSELSAALENVQLRDWLRSDPKHVVYYEKYCQEKYKREYCEKEIMDLQKTLLETKERVAGLDGILQIKTKSGAKYQKLWEGLIKKWKQHEAECASKIDKLEKENTELSKTVETQMTKAKEYEEELSKTVGLVEEFKERMEDMRKQFDAELLDWKCKMGFVQHDLNSVQGHLHQEKKEKESVKKALNEAQGTVQKLEVVNKNTSAKLQETEQKLESHSEKVELLTQEKEVLSAKVEKEREQKQVLERKLRAEFKEEIKKEGERLHIYYNDKVREILKSQSEKMTLAEAEFIKAHEAEIKNLSEQYEDRIGEMRNHFDNQMSNLKLYYKMEITKLEKESQEKGKLIENVSRELALFMNQDSNTNTRRTLFDTNAPNLFPPPFSSSAAQPPTAARIDNNFMAIDAQGQHSQLPQRKRNNSKDCNLAASNSNTNQHAKTTEKSPPTSLHQLMENSQSMKESIASLINEYKEKHNQ